jgi:Uncharacterized protein conserved in bacteria (DUF2199)
MASSGSTCACCDSITDELLFAWHVPAPAQWRPRYVNRENCVLDAELCVIKGRHFFVRGLKLKTNVHTQPVGSRLLIEHEPTDHPLAVEQRAGITWHGCGRSPNSSRLTAEECIRYRSTWLSADFLYQKSPGRVSRSPGRVSGRRSPSAG